MNFEKSWTEAECPKCRYKNDILLQDIKLESKIYCSNCKTGIQIKDGSASAHIAINQVNELLSQFNNLFK